MRAILANRRVIISGAATGIGKAIATKLAEDGFDLALHCNSHKDKALELKNELEEKISGELLYDSSLIDEELTYNYVDDETISAELTMNFIEKIGTETAIEKTEE